MAKCLFVQNCPFYAETMRGMPANASRMKELYCTDDFKSCARFMVGKQLGEARIPANLFPNQNERARTILAGG